MGPCSRHTDAGCNSLFSERFEILQKVEQLVMTRPAHVAFNLQVSPGVSTFALAGFCGGSALP